jgi:ferredoxin
VKKEWIIPYDDLQGMLMGSKSFRVRDCVCRKQQDLIGERKCTFPLTVCMSFSSSEWPVVPQTIDQKRALEILDETEKVGLVHTVSNVAEGNYYVCNCCGCCCGILRGITEFGVKESVAVANYYSVIDPKECKGCGICAGRCQVGAVAMKDGIAVVDRERCIGCGLCVSGCPSEVARLEPKPASERIDPPVNFAAWEKARLKKRGMM